MKKSIVVIALLVLIASIAALILLNRGSDPVPSVLPKVQYQASLYRRAAEAAQNRRVLLIGKEAGKAPFGDILASGRSGAGWALFPAAPPGADWLAGVFDSLSQSLAEDWADDGKFTPDSIQAMERFDVKLVVVEDGRAGVQLEAPPLSAKLRERPEIPALEIRYAQPIWHVLNERETIAATPELAFSKGLRLDKAEFGDVKLDLWSVALTANVLLDGEFLIMLPADGAHVRVDGVDVVPRRASLPFVKVPLTKGKHRLEVSFGQSTKRDNAAIFAAAGIVLSIIVLLLALRSKPRLADVEPVVVAEPEPEPEASEG